MRYNAQPAFITAFIAVMVFFVTATALAVSGEIASDEATAADDGITANIRDFATRYLGVRYKRGGTSTQGFDCSGFTRFIYKNLFGFDLPHCSRSQYRSPLLTRVSPDELRPGDIIFFASSPSKKRINHVGIYLDDNAFIHADLKRGISIAQVDDDHWKSRLVSIKRPVMESSGEAEGFDEIVLPSQRTAGATAASSLTVGYLKSFSLGLKCRLRYSFEFTPADYNSRQAGYSPYNNPVYPFPVRHSFRLAADMVPHPALAIAPAFFCNNYDDAFSPFYCLNRSYGVAVSLWSPVDRTWAASASIWQSPYRGSASAPRTASADSLDWQLTYNRQLNDFLLLSLTGERMQYPAFSDHTHTVSDDQRFFLQLHFFY